jgi:hypothetical protein
VSKNWLNDPKIDCKPPSNLVEMIKRDCDFDKLEEFVGFWMGWIGHMKCSQYLFDFHVFKIFLIIKKN